ncbi:helix-turn-helix domain-containing protein [Cohnella sp. AR92]|uniref:helix-turn-helix domain-containing protein n=1 Tax=Cohnella sp. AR92 TaxID=648716 RepID=UPI000F8E3D1B|nr:helix-turn-helix domain-containing protein [Cohnella sp. AR92]RUS47672.1 DNA-binding protein [Cohnella sp. AR92]
MEKPIKLTISVSEVAEMVGVSTGTIYTMARENQLPHVRVRGRILFYRDNIEKWLRGELQTAVNS